jgi:hypothetical protein
MKREILINAIESALPLLKTIRDPDQLIILLHYTENEPTKSDPTLMRLVSLLRAEPELEPFDGYMQVVA